MDTVLVIDDERLFLTLVRDELQKAGFGVLAAENAEQALEVLAKRPVQAILMDVVMPGMDGMELLPRILREHPKTPIIVVSGRASFLTGVQAMRLGAVDFLRKPLNIDELIRSITAAVQRGRETAPEAPHRLVQLERLQKGALELSNLIRWDSLGEFLKDNASLYQKVIDLIAEVLGVEIVSLMLLVESEGALKVVQAKGLDPEVQRKAVCPLGQGISGRVAQSGEPLLIRDLSQDPTFAGKERNPRYRTDSLMSVPLKVNGKVIGVMNANNKVTEEPFDDYDLALFMVFSCLVSLSFATTKLFEQLAGTMEELKLANARLGRANTELEARLKQLQALRGQRP
jgi:FixJ family two-component response regulator/putative methionine-R-sulfoxide reductase with GAF domain